MTTFADLIDTAVLSVGHSDLPISYLAISPHGAIHVQVETEEALDRWAEVLNTPAHRGPEYLRAADPYIAWQIVTPRVRVLWADYVGGAVRRRQLQRTADRSVTVAA